MQWKNKDLNSELSCDLRSSWKCVTTIRDRQGQLFYQHIPYGYRIFLWYLKITSELHRSLKPSREKQRSLQTVKFQNLNIQIRTLWKPDLIPVRIWMHNSVIQLLRICNRFQKVNSKRFLFRIDWRKTNMCATFRPNFTIHEPGNLDITDPTPLRFRNSQTWIHTDPALRRRKLW